MWTNYFDFIFLLVQLLLATSHFDIQYYNTSKLKSESSYLNVCATGNDWGLIVWIIQIKPEKKKYWLIRSSA